MANLTKPIKSIKDLSDLVAGDIVNLEWDDVTRAMVFNDTLKDDFGIGRKLNFLDRTGEDMINSINIYDCDLKIRGNKIIYVGALPISYGLISILRGEADFEEKDKILREAGYLEW